MAIFDTGSLNIVAGAERHDTARDPADTVTSASVQLVDTDGQWGTKVGNVLRWGVQASRSDGTFANDGTDWNNQGSVFQDNVAFGSLSRSGQLPMLLMRSFDADGNPLPIAPPGVKLRLAATVDTTIKMGAEIRTNADVQ